MNLRVRKGITSGFLAVLLIGAAACGSENGSNPSGTGKGNGNNQSDCTYQESETTSFNICDVRAANQVTLPVMANGVQVELFNSLASGDALNQPPNCNGDACGQLIQSGLPLKVVCKDDNTLGVVVPDDYLLNESAVKYWTTGKVDGQYRAVGFISTRGVENGDSLYRPLREALEKKFGSETKLANSCDNARVLLSKRLHAKYANVG